MKQVRPQADKSPISTENKKSKASGEQSKHQHVNTELDQWKVLTSSYIRNDSCSILLKHSKKEETGDLTNFAIVLDEL